MSENQKKIALSVNGKKVEMNSSTSLFSFLSTLSIHPQDKGIAIALDEEVVPKALWEKVILQSGSRIEIIRAVQGG